MVASAREEELQKQLEMIVRKYREDRTRMVYADQSVMIPVRYDVVDAHQPHIRMTVVSEGAWGIRLDDGVFILPRSRPDGVLAVSNGEVYIKTSAFDLALMMTAARREDPAYDESRFAELIIVARVLASR